ncbi:hypothetical protein F5X99DRAFT_153287 [Biscogniauxia marginata]|nr:hypothetical protein F5X99DRAFT_153287 [Biscogniauxia marginata]
MSHSRPTILWQQSLEGHAIFVVNKPRTNHSTTTSQTEIRLLRSVRLSPQSLPYMPEVVGEGPSYRSLVSPRRPTCNKLSQPSSLANTKISDPNDPDASFTEDKRWAGLQKMAHLISNTIGIASAALPPPSGSY